MNQPGDKTEDQPSATPAPHPAEARRGPLREANFRRLWFNSVAYFVVANAQRFVFGWLVLDGLDRGETEQGLVVFALGVPALILTLHAGAWADRLDRRKLLMTTQITAAAVMVATALLIRSGRANMSWVLVAALLAGATAIVGQPVRAALVPVLVKREQLFSAIAMNALAMTASMILGPVIAKLVGDQFGFDGAFWFQAILLGVGLLFLLQLEVPDVGERGPKRPIVHETLDAVRHVRADRSLRTLFFLLMVAGFTINPAVMVTLQAFIKEELGRQAGDVAPLLAMMGVGIAISSAVVMGKGDMANKGALFQRAMMTGATMTLFMGRATDYWQLFPLVLCMGLAGGFYINMNQGLIQANTPQHLMGRVMGLYTMVQTGFMPIGALVLGLAASRFGTGNTISVVAAIGLTTVVTTYIRNAELRRLS
ncbi:MAG: MFS transporter [Actinomycetia bacterium]|nr:MFS transporter [Actinomycetes bacterium]